MPLIQSMMQWKSLNSIDELSKIGNVKIPNAIEEIRNAPVRHKATCEVDEMPKVVKEFLGM